MFKLCTNSIIKVCKYTIENRFLFVSIGCLVGALLLASKEYVYTEKFLWVLDRTTKTDISPALLSTICGFALVLPVFIRCKADILHEPSVVKLILLLADTLIVATFVNCLLTGNNIIPGINVNGYTLLIGGIILSWLGIKAIAGYVWIILIVSSLFRIVEVDHAMGINGAIYICLCVVGIILQVRYVCGSLSELYQTFGEEFNSSSRKLRNDIQSSASIYNTDL